MILFLCKIECPFGYYGTNCSEACNFPHFGKECQSKCNCSAHLCDHITGCFENVNLSSKTVQVSYDTHVTPYQKESTSSQYKDSSFVKTLPNFVVYTSITFVIAFVVFFGLFSGTYFYRHCIKQTSISDGKELDKLSNQQEQYNVLLQSSHIERENNSDSAYIEPISNDCYEEIEIYAETVN